MCITITRNPGEQIDKYSVNLFNPLIVAAVVLQQHYFLLLIMLTVVSMTFL